MESRGRRSPRLPFFTVRSFFPFISAAVLRASDRGQAPVHTQARAAAAAQHARAVPSTPRSLAESGHCADALPSVTRAALHLTDREMQKRMGVDVFASPLC